MLSSMEIIHNFPKQTTVIEKHDWSKKPLAIFFYYNLSECTLCRCTHTFADRDRRLAKGDTNFHH